MKLLSETLTELGIAFSSPLEIKDANGKTTYYEDSDGYCCKYERDAHGNVTYYEDSDGYWCKYKRDAKGNLTYCEASEGYIHGIPRSAKTCDGKVVEVDGNKYELKAL
tara:strand:- start:165 stop:488 length:324 start_codon:yes stop_codon:yes gene_type:complete